MNFDHTIRQLQDAALVMEEIQQRQAEVQKRRAQNFVQTQESMRVHDQRMAHIDGCLARITERLGFMGGYFKGTQ